MIEGLRSSIAGGLIFLAILPEACVSFGVPNTPRRTVSSLLFEPTYSELLILRISLSI